MFWWFNWFIYVIDNECNVLWIKSIKKISTVSSYRMLMPQKVNNIYNNNWEGLVHLSSIDSQVVLCRAIECIYSPNWTPDVLTKIFLHKKKWLLVLLPLFNGLLTFWGYLIPTLFLKKNRKESFLHTGCGRKIWNNL